MQQKGFSPLRSTTKQKTPRLPQWSEAELRDLCRVARLAWNHAPGNARKARFTWRGRSFYATHSTFRLIVYTTEWDHVVSILD
jgi:hypothetical protein